MLALGSMYLKSLTLLVNLFISSFEHLGPSEFSSISLSSHSYFEPVFRENSNILLGCLFLLFVCFLLVWFLLQPPHCQNRLWKLKMFMKKRHTQGKAKLFFIELSYLTKSYYSALKPFCCFFFPTHKNLLLCITYNFWKKGVKCIGLT